MSEYTPTDPALSSLIFSSASLPAPLHAIDSRKKPHHIVSNRLASIVQDTDFVHKVAAAYELPVLANERCGSWYVPPDLKRGSVYFKSTDGHFGQWSFSLRRLNLGVLDLIGTAQGCIVVDSTRRGKHMPDALTKTIPIWCAILNRILFPDLHESHELRTIPELVSRSEHSQIVSRLSTFASQAKDLELDLVSLKSQLRRPLIPIWIAQSLPQTHKTSTLDDVPQYNRVVLCMPSKFHNNDHDLDKDYVQGAGDDSESWALGLTPEHFWTNQVSLMAKSEEALGEAIRELVADSNNDEREHVLRRAWPGANIFVSPLPPPMTELDRTDSIIVCADNEFENLMMNVRQRFLLLKCRPGKLGSKDLRKELLHLPEFIGKQWPWDRLIICCHTGKNLSIGVALAIVCLFANTEGNFGGEPADQYLNKDFVRKRLSKIMSMVPNANPSRATLNAINDFLIAQP